MSSAYPEFVAGFASRHDTAAHILQQAFASPETIGFSPADIRAGAVNRGPRHFAPEAANPKHFAPADPETNPTEGWDPFDPRAGEDAGFVDPIAAARAAGYTEGVEAAAAQAIADADRDRALLSELAVALQSAGRIDREGMARRLRQTVMLLVTKLVGETGVAADLLAARITAASDMLSDSTESALLRVHPDDLPLLEGKLPATLFAAGDAAVARGAFVLESASTIVEDGPELWLEQLAQAIERVAIPPSC